MYSGRRVLLIGYGALGSELLVDLEAAGALVVAILDDRFEELGAEPRVQGPISELATVLSDFEVDLMVVGASLIGSSTINWLTRHEKLFSDDEEPVETSIRDVHRVVPPPIDRVAVTERLGNPREIVALDPQAARRMLEGTRRMVTGRPIAVGSAW